MRSPFLLYSLAVIGVIVITSCVQKKSGESGKAASDPAQRAAPQGNAAQARDNDSADSASQSRAASAYACPMHPEVGQSRAGQCTKCGMNLQAVAAKSYECPMHPEVRQPQSGQCTKCGMNLQEVVAPSREAGPHDHAHSESADEGGAHTDHNPKHGGSLGMQGDYHVEIAVREGGNIEVYLYDAYTKPLSTNGLRGSVSLETPGAGGGSPKVLTVPLRPDASGDMLIARVSEVALAKWATVTVNFPEEEISMTLPLD